MPRFWVNLSLDFAISPESGRSFSVIPIWRVRSEFRPINFLEFIAGVVRRRVNGVRGKTRLSSFLDAVWQFKADSFVTETLANNFA
jgi:hypothetical protein